MNVTIYTDAAFDQDRCLGAWGAWCRSERGRVKGAALCSHGARSSTHAELQAGVEGVRLAKETWPDVTAALVVTDCEGVMVHLERRATRSTDTFFHEMRRALDEISVHVTARWVKGHQSRSAGTQAWLNAEVDYLAGVVLRQARHGVVTAANPMLASLRQRTRETLAARYGANIDGLRAARAWAATLLGRNRVRVGKLNEAQCETLLVALAAGEAVER
jgi:ribonuclease HI